jgi:hypothetical protein
MSAQTRSQRITVPDIAARKGRDKVVCLTAYTAPMAALLDPHCDLLLVGDSVGMVVHGLPSTVGVTLEMMILHGQAVMRAAKQALVVVDLPFGSYEANPEQAFQSASRIMRETGCQAVKVEASEGISKTIRFLVGRAFRSSAMSACGRRRRMSTAALKPRAARRPNASACSTRRSPLTEPGFRHCGRGRRQRSRDGDHPQGQGADNRHRRLCRLRRADPRHR